jgi:hypothetical protein
MKPAVIQHTLGHSTGVVTMSQLPTFITITFK